MSTAQKIIASTSGTAGGADGVYVENVFSTTAYNGTGSAQDITNGIDLDNEGGMVWTKRRDTDGGDGPWINDTARGIQRYHSTSVANQTEGNNTQSISAKLETGYTLGNLGGWNTSGGTYVSWTFRKASKFFDVQKWGGNDSSGTKITHDLGSTPGMVIIKKRSTDDSYLGWFVWHKELTTDAENNGNGGKILKLELDNREASNDPQFTHLGYVFTSAPDATGIYLNNAVNQASYNYVAYFFAHNDSDGTYGADGDQDIIKCGKYTGNGSTGNSVTLGFEPQWILVKRIDDDEDWTIYDSVRGDMFDVGVDANYIQPHKKSEEASHPNRMIFTPTGFMLNINDGRTNASGGTYIYVAIRKGPMKIPEVATTVFNVQQTSGGGYSAPGVELITNTGFPVDMSIGTRTTSSINLIASRLQGKEVYMGLDRTSAEATSNNGYIANWGSSNSLFVGDLGGLNDSGATSITYNFRRAPSFFDVVLYTGTGAIRTVAHQLGVVPELIIIKARGAAEKWPAYHSALGSTKYLYADDDSTGGTTIIAWNNTDPTSSVFTTHVWNTLNGSGSDYVAYLFASCEGVCKIGSYTGNGSNQTIDCGFSNGARFVLTKRYNTTGHWNVFDSVRGIVGGNDPRIEFDTDAAHDTGHDYIDPTSSGFIVNNVADDADDSNVNNATYIFMAIA